MNAICPSHQAALLRDPKLALRTCRQLIAEGTEQHQGEQYDQSCHRFSASVEICQVLIHHSPCPNLIALRVIAGHNLSASYVALGQNQHAEHTLNLLHQEICGLCQNAQLPRKVRLEALSQLQTTLFSLTSQLGHMGKSDALHNTITQTETIAESTAQQLFH